MNNKINEMSTFINYYKILDKLASVTLLFWANRTIIELICLTRADTLKYAFNQYYNKWDYHQILFTKKVECFDIHQKESIKKDHLYNRFVQK